MTNRTAEEYKEHIEGTFVRIAQKLDGAVNAVVFANMTQVLETMTDERMYALKRKLETANDWEVLAKFILPAVLADKDVRLRDNEGENADDTD